MNLAAGLIEADLGIPGVRGIVTTRAGGCSTGAWSGPGGEGGLNLGFRSGDEEKAVAENRARLAAVLPGVPKWLRQVHGSTVVDAERIDGWVDADASTSVTPGTVCAVLIADCMPVLLASIDGRGVGVAHAGWRGLAGGVIQNTARSLRRRLGDERATLVAYLGPAIGPTRFEVGGEVLVAMEAQMPQARAAFVDLGGGKYLADLFQLGQMALAQVAVDVVRGGGACTFSDPARFYSYRRDRVTGRHAALVWIESISIDDRQPRV